MTVSNSITPLVRREIESHLATARRMEESSRLQWRNAEPTSSRAARLGRETRSWSGRAAFWAAVLGFVDAFEHAPRLAEIDVPLPDKVHFVDNRNGYTVTCGWCGYTEPYAIIGTVCDPESIIREHVAREHPRVRRTLPFSYRDEESEPVPMCPFCGHGEHGRDDETMWDCLQPLCACRTERAARRPVPTQEDMERAGAAGLTPGELLRAPKALHYCARPGCGHGDNVHGPFCFAAGCVCADWVWAR